MDYFDSSKKIKAIEKRYGNCLLVQNGICEALPAPLPLSFELLKMLVSQKGATGQACRRLHIFYNSNVDISDYLLLIFGHTFINKKAEKVLATEKKGFISQLKTIYMLEKGQKNFYKLFIDTKIKNFDDYYATKASFDLRSAGNKTLFSYLKQVVKDFNSHYSLLIEAGFYLKYCLKKIRRNISFTNELNAYLLADIEVRFLDDWAVKIINEKKNFLKSLKKYGSLNEYELASPRYFETGDLPKYNKKPEIKKDIFLRRGIKNDLKFFKIYESLQEIIKLYLLREFSLIRNVLLEIDARLKLKGGVFWLTFEELRKSDLDISLLKKTIAKRQQSRKKVLEINLPTSLNIRQIRERVKKPVNKEMKGLAITNQSLRGEVRIIEEESDFNNLKASEIAVCKYASPNLVSIFGKVSGVITESGGLLSHISIVARELDFPLIVGVVGITKLLQTGDEIEAEDGHIKKIS